MCPLSLLSQPGELWVGSETKETVVETIRKSVLSIPDASNSFLFIVEEEEEQVVTHESDNKLGHPTPSTRRMVTGRRDVPFVRVTRNDGSLGIRVYGDGDHVPLRVVEVSGGPVRPVGTSDSRPQLRLY